jgi:peptide/nickel transport system substrate-binding protein
LLPIDRRAFLRLSVATGATLAAPAPAAVLPRKSVLPRPPAGDGRIVIGKRTDDIRSLDPHESVSSSAAEIIGNLYETLVIWDPVNKRFAPGLAARWEPSDDGLTWTFDLAPARKFSSGNSVTSEDVAFSLQRIFMIENAPSMILAPLGITAGNVKEVAKARQPAGQFVIKLPAGAPSRLLLHCLTASVCSVLDSKVVRAKCSTDPFWAAAAGPSGGRTGGLCDHGEGWLRFNSAGSGPFWVTNAVRTDEIRLQWNCHYRTAAHGRPILIRHIPDLRQQRRLLDTGEIHIARNLPDGSWPGDARELACNTSCEDPAATGTGKPRHSLQSQPPAGCPKANLLVLCMNVRDAPENQLRLPAVRQAIRLAIDVKSLAQDLNSKRWSPQAGLYPSVLRTSGSAAPPFSRDHARELLGGAKFELTIDHMSGTPRRRVVQILAKQLAEVGIMLKPRALDGRQFFADLTERQHQLALLSWNADYFDPHSNVHTFCVNSEIENRNCVSESRTMAWYCRWYDQVIADDANAAAIEADDAERKKKYDEIEKQLLDRGPFAFLLEEIDFAPKLSMGVIDSFTRYPAATTPSRTETCPLQTT